MTCIVGLAHRGRVYLGGDSAGVAGSDLTLRSDAKVFRREGYVMGFTSSFRMGQLLQYAGDLPGAPREHLDRFMATEFIDAARTIMADGGFRKKEFEVESGGEFLVGVRGVLFSVDCDFQIGRALRPFDAVGSGATVALGAMTIMEGMRLGADARIRRALAAAEEWNAGVRGPFVVVSGAVA